MRCVTGQRAEAPGTGMPELGSDTLPPQDELPGNGRSRPSLAAQPAGLGGREAGGAGGQICELVVAGPRYRPGPVSAHPKYAQCPGGEGDAHRTGGRCDDDRPEHDGSRLRRVWPPGSLAGEVDLAARSLAELKPGTVGDAGVVAVVAGGFGGPGAEKLGDPPAGVVVDG